MSTNPTSNIPAAITKRDVKELMERFIREDQQITRKKLTKKIMKATGLSKEIVKEMVNKYSVKIFTKITFLKSEYIPDIMSSNTSCPHPASFIRIEPGQGRVCTFCGENIEESDYEWDSDQARTPPPPPPAHMMTNLNDDWEYEEPTPAPRTIPDSTKPAPTICTHENPFYDMDIDEVTCLDCGALLDQEQQVQAPPAKIEEYQPIEERTFDDYKPTTIEEVPTVIEDATEPAPTICQHLNTTNDLEQGITVCLDCGVMINQGAQFDPVEEQIRHDQAEYQKHKRRRQRRKHPALKKKPGPKGPRKAPAEKKKRVYKKRDEDVRRERATLRQQALQIKKANKSLLKEFKIPKLSEKSSGSERFRVLIGLMNRKVEERSRQVIEEQVRKEQEQVVQMMSQVQAINNLVPMKSVRVQLPSLEYAQELILSLDPAPSGHVLRMDITYQTTKRVRKQRGVILNQKFLRTIRNVLRRGEDLGEDEQYKEVLKSLAQAYEIEFALRQVAKITDRNGAFFSHRCLLPLDLKELGIYGKDDDLSKVRNQNCLVKCFERAGFKDNDLIKILKRAVNGEVSTSKLKGVAEDLGVRIRLSMLRKDGGVRKTEYCKVPDEFSKDKKAVKKFIESKKPIEIGLINGHYFPIIDIPVTLFALRNYHKLKDVSKWWEIVEIRSRGGYRRKEQWVDSFRLVQCLLANEEKYLQPLSMRELMTYAPMEYNVNDIEPEKSRCVKVVYKERVRCYSGYLAFDTEACPFNVHKMFMCALALFDPDNLEEKIRVSYSGGPDCIKTVFSALPDNSRLQKEDGKEGPVMPYLCYVHNLKYDMSFIKNFIKKPSKIIINNGSMMRIQGWISGRLVEFRDSLRMIPIALGKFGKTFNLDQEKEIIPYKLYTEENVKKADVKLSVACALLDDQSRREEFLEKVHSLGFVKEKNRFDHLGYAKYYCERDVMVLAKGFKCFRKVVKDFTGLEVFSLLSIPSLANEYLCQQGVYEDVFKITGITRDFIQKGVVGGRCQLANNKQFDYVLDESPQGLTTEVIKNWVSRRVLAVPDVEIKHLVRELKQSHADYQNKHRWVVKRCYEDVQRKLRDSTKIHELLPDLIQDFDACSLYPTAMKRLGELGGLLKGVPKKFTNKETSWKKVWDEGKMDPNFDNQQVEIVERVNLENAEVLRDNIGYLQDYMVQKGLLSDPEVEDENEERYFGCVIEQAQKYLELVREDGSVEILYNRSGHLKKRGLRIGRLYASGGLGLQSLKKPIRQALQQGVYVDIDMSNAHPTILLGQCENEQLECEVLEDYVENREERIRELMEMNPGLTRDDCKQAFLSIMNGGKRDYYKIKNKSEFLKRFYEDIREIMIQLCEKKKYREYVNMEKKSSVDPRIRATNLLLTDIENSTLESIYKFLSKKYGSDWHCSLQFDGITVPIRDDGEYFLRECEQWVADDIGVDIRLELKEFKKAIDIEDFKEYCKSRRVGEKRYDYNFLQQQSGYFVRINLHRMSKKRAFPVISKVKNNKRMWDNESTGDLFVDKTTLEDLIKYHDVNPDTDFEIIDGYWFDKGRNNKIKEVIEYLYNERRRIKKEDPGNPMETVLKLLMNSAYGKTILKPISEEFKMVMGDKELDKLYLKKQNQVEHFTPLHDPDEKDPEKRFYMVKMSKSTENHESIPQVGVEILSMSKRIMNEVMYLAEDNGLKIHYQDTDSMHIKKGDIDKLGDLFKEKYGRELIGSEMGQFHSDFEDIVTKDGRKVKTLGSVRSIGIAKKEYLDKLIGWDEKEQKIVTKTFYRMKGIPDKTVEYRAKELGLSIEQLYEKILAGEEVEFDLTKGVVVSFEYVNHEVMNRLEFTRKIKHQPTERQ